MKIVVLRPLTLLITDAKEITIREFVTEWGWQSAETLLVSFSFRPVL